MKRFPILSILYYGFTIIFGIILAFYWFALGAQVKASETLTKRAKAGDSEGVVSLLNGYYNQNKVDTFEIANVGTVDIYEVVTTYTKSVTEDDKTTSYTLLEKGYMGIIYNVSDKWDRESYQDSDGRTWNKFGIRFNGIDKDGASTTYFYRIGYDANDSSITDDEKSEIQNRSASYSACGFYYFLLGDRNYESAASYQSFDVLTSKQEVAGSATFTSSYNLSSTFFETVEPLVSGYNELVLSKTATSDNVNKLLDEFTTNYEKHEEFKTSDYKDVTKNVTLYAFLKLLAYILIILIIGDFLVGKHRIIHFFKKLFGKDKSKFEENAETYYVKHELNATVEAVVPEGYDKTITIKYISEEQVEVVFNLNIDNAYKETKLITSGVYNHPTVIADSLKCLDIPSELKVNGLKYSIKLQFEANEEK